MPSWSQVIRDARSLIASDAKHAWKWLSVQLGFLTFLAPTIYENLDSVQDVMPRKVFAIVQAGLGMLVMLNAIRSKK